MTNKSLPVRLEVLVEGEHPERCSSLCACWLYSEEDGRICGAFGDQLELADEDGDPDSATLRSDDCLKAAAAAERDRAVVEAAVALRLEDFEVEDDFAGKYDALIKAVDATRLADVDGP